MDVCFERAGSTQRALRLLRQFRAVLQRESSRAHLDAKYAAIFARYTADLEGVRGNIVLMNSARVCQHVCLAATDIVKVSAPQRIWVGCSKFIAECDNLDGDRIRLSHGTGNKQEAIQHQQRFQLHQHTC